MNNIDEKHIDPQPEHGKDTNGHKDSGNQNGNGNGHDKKQTTAHGLV